MYECGHIGHSCSCINGIYEQHWCIYTVLFFHMLSYPLLQWNWKGLYWFQVVHPSVCPSVRLSLRLWTKLCLLCCSGDRVAVRTAEILYHTQGTPECGCVYLSLSPLSPVQTVCGRDGPCKLSLADAIQAVRWVAFTMVAGAGTIWLLYCTSEWEETF